MRVRRCLPLRLMRMRRRGLTRPVRIGTTGLLRRIVSAGIRLPRPLGRWIWSRRPRPMLLPGLLRHTRRPRRIAGWSGGRRRRRCTWRRRGRLRVRLKLAVRAGLLVLSLVGQWSRSRRLLIRRLLWVWCTASADRTRSWRLRRCILTATHRADAAACRSQKLLGRLTRRTVYAPGLGRGIFGQFMRGRRWRDGRMVARASLRGGRGSLWRCC